MANMIAVCHSAGDSQVIFESARALAKDNIPTTILVIGEVARTTIPRLISKLSEGEVPFISTIDLDALLPEKPINNKRLILTEAEVDELTETLQINQYSALLMGTPSYTNVNEQCQIPAQLLAKWESMIESAVVSDYAFFDPHHSAAQGWVQKAKKFFVPFAKAQEAFQVSNDFAPVVGHAGVDAVKSLYTQWMNERPDPRITQIKAKLGLVQDEKFIFVAGGKAGDGLMIKALAQTCKAFPDIKIFLGMHPGANPDYLTAIQNIIEESGAGDQIQFVPKGAVAVSTEEAVYASNGVATVTSTVGTTAAVCGKPVVFYQEGAAPDSESMPYIVKEKPNLAKFCISQNELLPFFDLVRKTSEKITVPVETTAAEKIASEMKKMMKYS